MTADGRHPCPTFFSIFLPFLLFLVSVAKALFISHCVYCIPSFPLPTMTTSSSIGPSQGW
ncbi:hypothetical protein LX32DRAFT_635095 [Colletotrichum zoysiae]|uniref:Uncharacterized protein n=1 Tax=Colletotrichum zoysiae TaxID=1216348 RepID=A0AAD9HRB3_9PEZI|nr:hypothetical protein LX32DRAFT_635095 [Colletotrichum zoysiae]